MTARGTRIRATLAAAALSLVVLGGLLFALDGYLHAHFEQMGGLNIRGYRGPLTARKQPGERRIIVAGESTVFGYGVPWRDAIPAALERKLNALRHSQGHGPVSVVNVAQNREGAYGVNITLRDYASLDYDVALIYTGVTDLEGNNTLAFRHQSAIFRLTGYLPILPVVFREKAMALRHGGDLAAAYRGQGAVSAPAAARAAAAVLEGAAQAADALDAQMGRIWPDPALDPAPRSDTVRCPEPWGDYCDALAAAVDYVLGQGKQVVVVRSLPISSVHRQQQRSMAAMLQSRFAAHPRLTILNAEQALDLGDPALCYDGRHLTAAGHDRIAELLVPQLNALLP